MVKRIDVIAQMKLYMKDPSAFLRKHHAGPSTGYDLLDSEGQRYPPAAIYQAAAGQNDAKGGLKAPDSAGRKLKALGFRVIAKPDKPRSGSARNIDDLVAKLRSIVDTEKTRETVQRIGTNILRKFALQHHLKCEVSDIDDPDLLRVSHIVPWKEDVAQLDPDNIILLSALWDAAFDKYLISFDNDGKVIYSDSLNLNSKKPLLASELRKLALNDQRRAFLAEHRARLR